MVTSQSRVHFQEICHTGLFVNFDVEHTESVPIDGIHEPTALLFYRGIRNCDKRPGVALQARGVVFDNYLSSPVSTFWPLRSRYCDKIRRLESGPGMNCWMMSVPPYPAAIALWSIWLSSCGVAM